MTFEFGAALFWAIFGAALTAFAAIINSLMELLPITLFCFGVSQAWLIAGFIVQTMRE